MMVYKRYLMYFFMLFFFTVLLQGCGGKDITPEEFTRIIAVEISEMYLEARAEYEALLPQLTEEGQDWAMSNIAPVLNKMQDATIAYNRGIIAWYHIGERPDDLLDLEREIRQFFASVMRLIGQAEGITNE